MAAAPSLTVTLRAEHVVLQCVRCTTVTTATQAIARKFRTGLCEFCNGSFRVVVADPPPVQTSADHG